MVNYKTLAKVQKVPRFKGDLGGLILTYTRGFMTILAVSAFLQGVLGASSMALGAVIAVSWQPSRKFSAAIMAFGSGTLIAAIAL